MLHLIPSVQRTDLWGLWILALDSSDSKKSFIGATIWRLLIPSIKLTVCKDSMEKMI